MPLIVFNIKLGRFNAFLDLPYRLFQNYHIMIYMINNLNGHNYGRIENCLGTADIKSVDINHVFTNGDYIGS